MAAVSEASLQTPDITKCLICLATIKEPNVLSCIHTFCVECLNDYCSNNKPGEGESCPLCSRIFIIPSGEMKEVSSNFFINQLLDIKRSTGSSSLKKPHFCQVCSDSEVEIPSTLYCIECDQHICDRCSVPHKRIKSSMSHQVILHDDILSPKEKLFLTTSYCDQHPSDEKRLYCYDCKLIMCQKCVKKPNKHALSEINESKKKLRQELKENVDRVSAYTSQKQEEIIQLETDKKSFMKKFDFAQNEIFEKYDQLLSLVQTHRNQLMKQLHEFKDKVLKEIENKRDEIETQCVIRESFKRYCMEMMNKGLACDISRTAHDLRSKTEELVMAQDEPACLGLSRVEITFKPSLSITDITNNLIGELLFKDTRCDQKTSEKKSQVTTTLPRVGKDEGKSVTDKTILDQTNFQIQTPLLHVETDQGRPVMGVTALGSDIYIIRQYSYKVDVYSSDSFFLSRQIPITGSKELLCLVSCSHHNCLYICDSALKIVYRHDVTSNQTSKWSAFVPCNGLSVNKCNHNVLATLYYGRKEIQEYTTNGCLVREIRLDRSIVAPYHCVQLSTGNYVVSHSGNILHRVCIVDQSGRLLQSFGGPPGPGREQLDRPRLLAVDAHDNILVTDYYNNRVKVLSPTLTYLGDITIPRYCLGGPISLHIDDQNHRLYIGEYAKRRLFVVDADFKQE